MKLKPIGVIRTPFKTSAGTPIQPKFAVDSEGRGAQGIVEVFDKYVEGLKDLDGFDRIWLLYWLHRASQYRPTVTPFLDNVERGLFATRAPCRPNPIGLSPVRLLQIEGNVLHVADVDILDRTPLLDIKPYAPRFDHFSINRSGWLDQVQNRRAVADGRFALGNMDQDTNKPQ